MADVIIVPKQNIAPLSTGSIPGPGQNSDPLDSALFNKTWWLFFNSLAKNSGASSSFPWLTVKDRQFGAVGNGVADDTDAIQAAIDYCTTNKLGLFFPSGIYVVSGLEITDAICIFGTGMDSVIIQNTSNANPTLYIHGVDDTHVIGLSSPFTGVDISGIQLLGDPANVVNGLEMAFVARSSFTNVMIQQHGNDGINIGFSFGLKFDNCHVIQNRRDGYRLDKTLHASTLTDDQNDIYFSGGSVVGNYGRGLNIVGGGARNWVIGVDFEANRHEAILAMRPYGLYIQSFFENNGRENNSDTIKTIPDGSGNPGFGLQVRNCRAYGSANQAGIPNAFNPTPVNTWSLNIGAMYDAIIDGNEFGNSYAGAITVDSACVGTYIGTNYYSGESTNVADAGFGTIRFGNDKYNSSILQAVVFQNLIQTMYTTADFQQSIWRSRQNNPVSLFLTSATDQQASLLLQNHATAHATIVAGVITGIVIDAAGYYGAQTAIASITGDGTGATLGAVTMAGGQVTAIAVSAGGTGYTTAVVEITPANVYQLGRAVIGATPVGTDVGAFLFDVINGWNIFEALINGNLALSPAGGVVLVGTGTAFDGATLFQVNGGVTIESALKTVWLGGSGTRMLTVDNVGVVAAATIPSSTSPVSQLAAASAQLTPVTTSYQDIPGCTITLSAGAAASGTCLIRASVQARLDNADGSVFVQLVVNGSAQTVIGLASAGTGIIAFQMISQEWRVAVAAGQIVKLQAKKAASGGGLTLIDVNSTIVAQLTA